ncbi:MAG: VanW family protein [Defluviitaleaceae bacterium]|nr:VanW family protein [Defluviitaleaceae bacterium]
MKKIFIRLFILAFAIFVLTSCDEADADHVVFQTQDSEGPDEVATIRNNVFINDINIGGLTPEAALEKLNTQFANHFNNTTLTLTFDNEEFVYSFSEFNASFDFEAAVNMAFRGEISSNSPQSYRVDAMYTYDASIIEKILAELYEKVTREPENATMERIDGEFVITNDVIGRRLDLDNTNQEILDILASRSSGVVELSVVNYYAEFTAEHFRRATSLLGTYTTYFSPGENGRNINIRNAASKIDGFVLMPGEIFSTNAEFGVMTYDNGYRMAPVIVGGVLQDGMGGGVCQVSSTLYVALLYAELRITERLNHSMPVAYIRNGLDATLAGDWIDLKFENDTDYPVFIEAIVTNNSHTVNVFGFESRNETRELEFRIILVETIPPPEENIIEDPNIPLGERRVTITPLTGRRYRVYKDVFENGELVETVHINNSNYRARAATVRVGTGAGAPPTGTGETPPVTTPPTTPPYEPPVTPPPTNDNNGVDDIDAPPVIDDSTDE